MGTLRARVRTPSLENYSSGVPRRQARNADGDTAGSSPNSFAHNYRCGAPGARQETRMGTLRARSQRCPPAPGLRESSAPPIPGQHGIHINVHRRTVQDLPIPPDAFELKPQPLRNPAALFVPRGAMDFNPDHPPRVECVIDRRAASGRHDAFSLRRFFQPIAEFYFLVGPVDPVETHRPHAFRPAKDSRGEPLIFGKLLERHLDECFHVVDRVSLVHPRQPPAQIFPISRDGLINERRMPHFQNSHLRAAIQAVSEHKLCWQCKAESRSVSQLRLYPNTAAMALHYPAADRQAQSDSRRASVVQSLEQAEDPVMIGRIDADTVVHNAELPKLARFRGRDLRPRWLLASIEHSVGD